MKKSILFLIYLIIIITLLSCQYFSLMSYKEWEEITENEDDIIIYCSGFYVNESSNYIPCYWKIKGNKVERVNLESNAIIAIAAYIYVTAGNVYTAGFIYDTSQKACYWKNKNLNLLEVNDSSLSSQALSIAVNNGITFIAGSADDKQCFWINNQISYIGIEKANSVFVKNISSSKYETYFGGQNSDDQACYIDNLGILNNLPYGTALASEVYSIYVAGNDVYCSGSLYNMQSCMWINNDLMILPQGKIAYSVFVYEADVYASGEIDGPIPCYWKNRKCISLPHNGNSSTHSIYIFNNDAYVSGYDTINSNMIACFWINNDTNILLEESNISAAYSLFVTRDYKK